MQIRAEIIVGDLRPVNRTANCYHFTDKSLVRWGGKPFHLLLTLTDDEPDKVNVWNLPDILERIAMAVRVEIEEFRRRIERGEEKLWDDTEKKEQPNADL